MGEIRRWSISVDEETEQIAAILQERYSAMLGDKRSRLVQFILKSWYRLNITAANVTAALEQSQGISRATSSEPVPTFNNLSQVPAFPSIGQEKKPLTRATHRRVAREGQAIHGVNRKVSTAMGPYVTAFPGKVNPINSTPYAEVA